MVTAQMPALAFRLHPPQPSHHYQQMPLHHLPAAVPSPKCSSSQQPYRSEPRAAVWPADTWGASGALDALPDAVRDGADRGAAKTNPRPLPLDSMPRDAAAAGVGLKPRTRPAPPPAPPISAAPLTSCDGCHFPAELLPEGPDLPSLDPPPDPSPDPAVGAITSGTANDRHRPHVAWAGQAQTSAA